ncbi:hypothetical protein BO70DRAFT_361513 [Aspergillus heteromorphus CBS 117.55]|uniref:Uncharacterized protein n=1 Tax=Aspergillus heteromorphus CBS 117.55 TaxID=1448321 RepID=A0A317WA40_9EURO|nr:uncharacterized protein BO70DRAFT_361513 [Aspergillus heteromorphus CBS 117.55]PWY83394.1 hypothetical protein BO70DRAFT_361513 [Aspergillus heteromorphus CBS 117.55]
MTEEVVFDTPLSLNLYEDFDDDEDLWYKGILVSLVTGDVTPTQAAIDIDTYITQLANQRYEAYQEYQELHPGQTPTDEEERDRVSGPNPRGDVEMLIQWAARLCSAFPPSHAGQERIISFLEALRDLPRHKVLNVVFPREEGDGMYTAMELWPLRGRWLSLQQEFRYIEDEVIYRTYRAKQPPPSEPDLRWRNFQSAIARITALDLINCDFMCSLGLIIPSHSWYPDLEDGNAEGFNWVAGQVIAAVQWLLRPEVGRYVYQQCRNADTVASDDRRVIWSLEKWGQWKEQLARVGEEQRFGVHARELAKLACQRMALYERGDAVEL